MMDGGKKPRRNAVGRAVFVALSLALQVGWLLLVVIELNKYSGFISLLTNVLVSLVVLRLYSKHTNSAYKMPWIMLMMALPVMGLSLYLLTEVAVTPKSIHKRVRAVQKETAACLPQGPEVLAALKAENRSAANLSGYLWNHAQSPVYQNTQVSYFGHGSRALESMLADLEQAKDFIFMEYFIVEDKVSFGRIREVLKRKAAQGVDVRLMYDDIGSVGYVDWAFARELNREGIRCQVFNPALPVLNLFMNNRDHRKITVIDGKVGYIGGYNLADAYFGLEFPYGQWKDTGIRLEGEAVRSLTAAFLELWTVTSREPADFERYLTVSHRVEGTGWVQPYWDSPLDREEVAENVYLNLINRAEKYVWFMTPYLIITDELSRALELAAKRGVDVRIITPGVPDKKTVYAVTRSYYARLISQGVRIFEYSPGFCHGKQCLVDGELASIGTSNLDYRSLYLHFENNVLLYGCDALRDMERDFAETFDQCREVNAGFRSTPLRIWQCILRLFAPLL